MSQISEVILEKLSSCYTIVVQELEDYCKDKKEDDDWDGSEDKFKAYQTSVCQVLRSQSAFQQITIIYITSYGLFKMPDNNWTLKLFQGSEKLVLVLSRFYAVWKANGDKLGLGETIEGFDSSTVLDETFRNMIGKLHKHVSWNIGMTAYQLIKKEPKKKEEKANEDDPEDVKRKRKIEKYREQILQNIISSNLLSGGIEIKHLTNISESTKDELMELATLMDDQEMLKNLKVEKKKDDDGDFDILQAAAFQGKNEDTDKLITALHNIQRTGLRIEGSEVTFTPNLGLAMVGRDDGMKLARAAFAIMIKFSDLMDDFQTM